MNFMFETLFRLTKDKDLVVKRHTPEAVVIGQFLMIRHGAPRAGRVRRLVLEQFRRAICIATPAKDHHRVPYGCHARGEMLVLCGRYFGPRKSVKPPAIAARS